MTDIAKLKIEVTADGVAKVTSGLEHLTGAAEKAEGTSSKTSKSFLGLNSTLGKTALALAKLTGITSVGVALAAAAGEAKRFEAAMAEVSTLTNTMNMEGLTNSIKDLSAQFGADKIQSAKALYQVISAGASTAEDAMKTLTVANKLAVGGVTDVATAADGLTSAMNAYGLGAESATALSDSMFVAMKAGKTTIGELSGNIGKLAPIAAQAGVSFDELMAATAAVTKTGLDTSMTMNSLRQVISNVIKPTKQAQDEAERLGISFNAAALESKGLVKFLAEIVEKNHGAAESMAELFGSVESLQSILFLASETGGKEFATILDQVREKSGATEEAFGKMSKTTTFLSGVLREQLKNEVLGIGGAMLEYLNPALVYITTNFDKLKESAIDLGKILGAGVLYMSLTALPRLFLGIRSALVAVTLATKAWTIALLSNPVIAIAKILIAAGTALYLFRDKLVTVSGVTMKLGELVSRTWTVVSRTISVVLNDVTDLVKKAYKYIAEATTSTTKFFRADWGQAWEELGKIVKKGINFILKTVALIVKGWGTAIGIMVTKWEAFWNYLADLASAGWDGIKKVFQGDLGFDELKKQLEEGLQAPGETIAETYKALWKEVSGADYVGEVFTYIDSVKQEVLQLGDASTSTWRDMEELQGAASWWGTPAAAAVGNGVDTATGSVKELGDILIETSDKMGPFEEALTHTAERIDEAFASAWKGAFNSFSDFASSLKDAFISLLAELAHLAITRPIVVSIASSMGLGGLSSSMGGGGILSGANAASGIFGKGGLLSGVGSVGTSIFSSVASLYGGASSALSDLAMFLGPDTFLGNIAGNASLSSTLSASQYTGSLGSSVANAGMNMGAGFLGNWAGSQLFGDSKYGSYGGTVGGMVGSIWGPIGTAIGSFIGNGIASLFGGTQRADRTALDLDFASGSVTRGRSRGHDMDDAANSIADALMMYSEAIGGSTANFQIRAHGEYGLGFEGEGKYQGYTDPDKFVVEAMKRIAAEAENLTERARELILGFEGSSEQLARFSVAVASIEEMLNTDVFKNAADDIREMQKAADTTAFQSFSQQSAQVLNFVDRMNGSAASFEMLAEKLAINKQMAYELSIAIAQLTDSLTNMLTNSAQQIRESVMTEEERVAGWTRQRDILREQLNTLIDPEQISRTATEIDRLNNLIFGSLDEEQQKARAEEFASIAEETARIVEERMKLAMEEVVRLQEEVNAKITAKLGEAADAQQAAADTQQQAANAQLRAANTPVSVDVNVVYTYNGTEVNV